MAIPDQIDAVESGGNPNAANPNSSASSAHMFNEFLTDTRIVKLLFGGRPSAIFRRVVAIKVDAVNGISFSGMWSHISKKILKSFPSFTDLNASFAIPLVRDVLRIVASRLHRAPRMVFASSLSSTAHRDGHSMSAWLEAATPTAFGIPGFKVVRPHHDDPITTITHARHAPDSGPSIFASFGLCFAKDEQLAKSHSDIVFAGAHS